MESGAGLENAVLHARLNSAKRDAGGWEAEFHKARAGQNLSSDRTWYWGVLFGALRAVFWELAKRYPQDPLFKVTGRKRPDGSPEMEYHKLFDQNVTKQIQELPAHVNRGQALRDFVNKAKI